MAPVPPGFLGARGEASSVSVFGTRHVLLESMTLAGCGGALGILLAMYAVSADGSADLPLALAYGKGILPEGL